MPELGRGPQSRRIKHRATPSGYPDDGPIKIGDAYSQLTHHAFAVWMRLMVATEDELRIGRGRLARLLGYSEGRSNTVLRELKRKGYITWITSPGMPSECVVLRRGMISGKTHFVRLSSLFADSNPGNSDARIDYPHFTSPENPHITVPTNLTPVFLPTSARILTHIRSYSYPHPLVFDTHNDLLGQRPVSIGPCNLSTLRAILRGEQDSPRKRKFVSEKAYKTNSRPTSLSANVLSYKERIQQKVLIEKQQREKVRSGAKRSGGRAGAAKIDFSKLDQRGDPAVSFDPDSHLRDQMLELIARPERDPERRKVMAKLGTEFGRIYTRYRRSAEAELGRARSIFAYDIPDREKAYAAEAGMWCVIKGVTPRELLEYWHKHIKTFADRKLKVPPLSLIKSPGMVDQVACSTMGDEEPPQRRRKGDKKNTGTRPRGGNSFSDSGTFDRRLRRALERAGFDTQDYSDRYLATIQQLAIGISQGQEIFVPLKIKDMVHWAAENMYA